MEKREAIEVHRRLLANLYILKIALGFDKFQSLLKMNKFNSYAMPVSRIVLGLMFVVAGLTKLFVSGSSGVESMLMHIGFPIPLFFAWVLIIVEVFGGILLLLNYKTKYVAPFLIVIMLVAGFTTAWGRWSTLFLHISAAASLWVVVALDKKK